MKTYPLREDIEPVSTGYGAGRSDLLNHDALAVYCSRRIPLSVLEACEQTIQALSKEGIVLAGGWHSRTEKHLLKVAVQAAESHVIYFLAKGIEHFHLPTVLRPLYAQQRLLILSPFRTERRITRRLVERRDAWMRSLIERYLFCYLDPRGTTANLLQRCLEEGKCVFVLDHPQNAPFIKGAVRAINRYTYREVLSP